MSAPVLLRWRGRPVEELTRDELLAALRNACEETRRMREDRESERRMTDMFRTAIPGSKP